MQAPARHTGVGRRRQAQAHHHLHARDHHIRRARPSSAAAAAAAGQQSPLPSPASLASPRPPPPPPILLLQTKNKACLTTAIEAGRLTAAVFTRETRELARLWRKLARFEALLLSEGRLLPLDEGHDENAAGAGAAAVGRWARVPDPEALRRAEASLSSVDPSLRYVVVDSLGGGDGDNSDNINDNDGSSHTRPWRLIPAENLVAFAQQQPWWRSSGSRARLLATAATSADVGALLGSLEAGTDGVVLVTEDPAQVREACAALERRARAASPPLLLSTSAPSPSPSPSSLLLGQRRRRHPPHPVYEEAVVTRVEPVGMADRACVDLASALQPGQGLLVGCFARALFLVHSERDETSYIAARPFRVNAGPLAQYVLAEVGGGGGAGGGGRTAYLSELRCGRTVAVAGADGRLADAEAVVARVKVERRPVVLVEAETPGGGDGQRHSVLLQNAETVKLVGPRWGGDGEQEDENDDEDGGGGTEEEGYWRAVSVAQLAPGDRVYVLRQPAARHTGLAIDEGVSER